MFVLHLIKCSTRLEKKILENLTGKWAKNHILSSFSVKIGLNLKKWHFLSGFSGSKNAIFFYPPGL